MIIFIAISLILSFIVQTDNPLRSVLSSSPFIYVGLFGAVVSIIGSVLKKWPERFWTDIFASSALILWFAYWQPFFKEESPMFFFFPLFFAIIASFFSLAFITQRDKLDTDTLKHMRILSEQLGLQPWVIMLCILGSLELQEHFQVFPVMVTLLVLRYTLSRCIEKSS
ncbi:MAG: hypothetical protein ACU84H_12025 [Gammaproteobacteria bacterium]